MRKKRIGIIVTVLAAVALLASTMLNEEEPIIDRESKIPADAVKITPETDKHPPITVSDEYEQPVPLPYPINTKGAEDSAFIVPDGNTLYVWFTPDTKGDVHAQATDMVTGIYVSKKVNGQWQNPERVWLIEPGKAVLDGCEFISDSKMWFCSAREGYTGLHWFTAELIDGKWTNWENADFNPAYEVGELHIHEDELYFHSSRTVKGEYDIWVSKRVNGEWGEPENIAIINSEFRDGWPWISQDGKEMWFSRLEGAPNLYRSKKVDGKWTEPELMIKTLAGEASLDNQGNVYFTHHYSDDEGNMLESDIYVAYKKEGPYVPHEEKWGIYALDPVTEEVELIHSSSERLSYLRLNNAGDRFVFSQNIGGSDNEKEEICTLRVDGSDFVRVTNNSFWDLYPSWSPDDSRIAFLTWRENDLDIYVINANSTNETKLYDSGSHDADIHWMENRIVFTSHSQIWSIKDDGTDPFQITDPPNAGQWGNANLPFGDYDPRLSPDGSKVVFERLLNDTSPHGNYDIFIINLDGTGETRLTSTGYSQGLASWSHSGEKIVYIIAAVGNEGKYDICLMNSDGTSNRNITPDYFSANFLCHSPVFSVDDSKIFFIGEWWDLP